jgi:hypothetical protein
MMGEDNSLFTLPISLFIFINGFSSSSVDISSSSSSSGDESYCGTSQYPCISISSAITRLNEGGKERKLNVLTTLVITGSVNEMGDETLATISFPSSLSGNDDFVLSNGGSSSFGYFLFEFPSAFENEQNVLISSSVGELEMEECEMKHDSSPNDPLSFFHISLSSVSLLFFSSSSSLSFSFSFSFFLLSSSVSSLSFSSVDIRNV